MEISDIFSFQAPKFNTNFDASANIKKYTAKPIRKRSGTKKLSKKQRKLLNINHVSWKQK